MRSKPLSEATVWIKRNVVMSPGAKRRSHNVVESIAKPKEPEAETECNLEVGEQRRFQRGMESRRRAKRLPTMHKVMLDSVSTSPRRRSVSAKPKRITRSGDNNKSGPLVTSNPLDTHS